MSEYPIQRLIVYNVVPGTTTITWDMHPRMHDPGDYRYQLQVNRLPNHEDGEWENVGGPQVNVFQLEDATTESHAYKLDKYYRIILTTDRGEYVSPIEGCFGQLHRYEWKLAQEIIRKEVLRHNNVSIPCILFKRKTSGEKCPHCTDGIVGGSNNSECPYCYGTGYRGGYHAPFNFRLVEISPTQLMEKHESDNVTTFNISVNRYEGRALGVPELDIDDIILDLSTSQRFKILASQVAAQLRRVPLVRTLDMLLLPFSDPAYNIPVDAPNYDNSFKKTLTEGCGYKLIDHNFKEENDLQYVTKEGMPVAGATVEIFSNNEQVFKTSTDTQGKWNSGYMAPLGTYTVKFHKPGFYGIDEKVIEVTQADLNEEEAAHYSEDNTIKSNTGYLKHFL